MCLIFISRIWKCIFSKLLSFPEIIIKYFFSPQNWWKQSEKVTNQWQIQIQHSNRFELVSVLNKFGDNIYNNNVTISINETQVKWCCDNIYSKYCDNSCTTTIIMTHFTRRINGIVHELQPTLESGHLEQSQVGHGNIVKIDIGINPNSVILHEACLHIWRDFRIDCD